MRSLPFEQLEPSGVEWLTSKPVTGSAHGIAGPVLVLDGLRNWIECPKLSFSVLIITLLRSIRSAIAFHNSLHWKSGSD